MIGGWLGDRDFGACGGTILGKNAPAKQAPPLFPMLPPPQPSFQVCSSKTAEGSCEGSQVSACKTACFLPPGPGWISDPLTTIVFGLFFFFLPSFLLQQLQDWLAHGASRQHLIRNEEASLS